MKETNELLTKAKAALIGRWLTLSTPRYNMRDVGIVERVSEIGGYFVISMGAAGGIDLTEKGLRALMESGKAVKRTARCGSITATIKKRGAAL